MQKKKRTRRFFDPEKLSGIKIKSSYHEYIKSLFRHPHVSNKWRTEPIYPLMYSLPLLLPRHKYPAADAIRDLG